MSGPRDRATARRCRRGFWTLHVATGRAHRHGEQGFTLVELLIVVTITPLIIGSLAFGLVTMFKLQSGVQSRLSDTEDAQVVTAAFQPDVQGAILAANDPTPMCGSGTGNQLLGLVFGPFVSTTSTSTSATTTTTVAGTTTTTVPVGYYSSAVSYDLVQSGSTWNLVREYCNDYIPGSTNQTPVSSEVLAYDMPAPGTQSVAEICLTGSSSTSTTTTTPTTSTTLPCNSSTATDQSPDPTTEVETVSLTIDEPASSYSYTLAAAPESTSNPGNSGGPIAVSTSSSCDYPAAGSGPLASSLCLLDFSSLFSNQTYIQDAEVSGSCLEESVVLSQNADGTPNFTLYFCINISNSNANELIEPFALPTYCQAFLGNPGPTTGCPSSVDSEYPNYYDIPGEPALYQQGVGNGVTGGYVTTITLKYIKVVNSEGVPATGWEMFGADAESTDQGSGSSTFAEGITWNSTNTIALVPNGYTSPNYCSSSTPCDKLNTPFGNACDGQPNVGTNGTNGTWTLNGKTYYGISSDSASDQNYFTNENTDTVTCTVPPSSATVTTGQSYPSTGIGSSTALDGAAMVESETPSQFSATMTDGSGGLEAVVFGMVSS